MISIFDAQEGKTKLIHIYAARIASRPVRATPPALSRAIRAPPSPAPSPFSVLPFLLLLRLSTSRADAPTPTAAPAAPVNPHRVCCGCRRCGWRARMVSPSPCLSFDTANVSQLPMAPAVASADLRCPLALD